MAQKDYSKENLYDLMAGTKGASASYENDASGANTLLAAAGFDRIVRIHVAVDENFADGDGTQPTFAIGETGTADKFAATTVFADATTTDTFELMGTLSADAALLVTAVAATGTTSTGGITVTVQAVPAA